MFTIDLLKGQGIPVKSRPEGIALTAVTFAVPVIAAIVLFGSYLHTKIVMSVDRQQVIVYDKRIRQLSDPMELQQSFEKEKNVVNGCLSEVSSSVDKYVQWSPILVALAENMPASVALTSLEVGQRSIQVKVPKKDDPQKTVESSVPVKTLHMSISPRPGFNAEKQIRDFRDRLRSCPSLETKLADIRVSKEVDSQNIISYKIDCTFKPRL